MQETNEPEFWKFSPGRSAEHWEDFKKLSIIAMGSQGIKLDNLNTWPTVEEFRQNFPDFPASPNPQSDSANQLYNLKNLKSGTIIVVYGNKSIYGIGTIPKDSMYEFDNKSPVYWWGTETPGRQHWRKIDWIKELKPPVNIENDIDLYNDLSQQDTLHKIKQSLIDKIKEIMNKPNSSYIHLVYKIAWRPSGYRGGFCGDPNSVACEAFNYVRRNKQEQPCSQTRFHCIDEHSAFSNDKWSVTIHPPRLKRLNELVEGKSLVFLVAPLDRFKNNYSLIGFYTIALKEVKEGNVEALVANRELSSEFNYSDPICQKSAQEMLELFGIKKWSNPRSSYEYITTEQAVNALKLIFEKHKEKQL